MLKEAIGVGSSLEAAKEDAIAQLNARDDDDIQFEVLEQPHKKAFGLFGSTPAKIRAFVEIPDAKPATKKNNNKSETSKVEKKPEKKKFEKREDESDVWPEAVSPDTLERDSKAAKACAYLKEILTLLGCENVELTVSVRENGAKIMIAGENMGVAIGRKGDTLDAIQHLTSLSANAAKGGYFRVYLNIGDYREKREQTLISLANKIASQVKRTGRNRSLEPMNPYERRIIHTAIQDIPGVTSSSVGEGKNRKVVVSLEKGAAKSDAQPASEPKKDSDVPLYGQIN